MKSKLKKRAIYLRESGLSYTEILSQIPVSKSTLSLWLKSVNLSSSQKQKLTQKKLDSIKRGWEAWSLKRTKRTMRIAKAAIKDIENLKIYPNNLLLIGIALYWAEGAKEKKYRPGQGVSFSNSDPRMIKLFILWLIKCIRIKERQIYLDIYIHNTHKERINDVIGYWSQVTGFHEDKFDKIYFKNNKINTNRKNTGDNYNGLIRVRVAKSSSLNRKIAGWIEGVCIQCGVV